MQYRQLFVSTTTTLLVSVMVTGASAEPTLVDPKTLPPPKSTSLEQAPPPADSTQTPETPSSFVAQAAAVALSAADAEAWRAWCDAPAPHAEPPRLPTHWCGEALVPVGPNVAKPSPGQPLTLAGYFWPYEVPEGAILAAGDRGPAMRAAYERGREAPDGAPEPPRRRALRDVVPGAKLPKKE